MTANGWLQIALYLLVLTALTRPLGRYLQRVFDGERLPFAWLERSACRLAGIDPAQEQGWRAYTMAMLAFSAASFVAVYAILLGQRWLPLNPQGFDGLSPHLAFNTAISFVTNTNWQSYGGETTLSYAAQMLALAVQNFASAAVGIALAIALIRGFARRSAQTLGNFWVDLLRATLYVLLPLSLPFALLLVWQGVPQTFAPYAEATTLEGAKQVIALGPVASQEAIKMLGTNGGGFFNANSAHPFENPTALSNFLEMLAIFAISAALTNCFGRMVGNERQGWALYVAMAALFLAGVTGTYAAEAAGRPQLAALGVDQQASPMQAGGNLEGKETRFGIAASALFATATTDASCGAVNSMHDSYTPLGGLVPLLNMMLGEVIFGGVGAGLYGMLLYAVLAVFIAGLMVGRTPEYLGKKIEAREMKLMMLAFLCLPLASMPFLAWASVSPTAQAGLANDGPHGFSEMLYAYVSAMANNGSAFAGLNANAPFWDLTLAGAMLVGRFAFIVPMMALAGSLAAKRALPASAGSFPTTGSLFIGLLVGVILIVTGLTWFPALALGPIAEQLALLARWPRATRNAQRETRGVHARVLHPQGLP